MTDLPEPRSCAECGQLPTTCRICGLFCCPCFHKDDVPMFDVERPIRHLRSVE